MPSGRWCRLCRVCPQHAGGGRAGHRIQQCARFVPISTYIVLDVQIDMYIDVALKAVRAHQSVLSAQRCVVSQRYSGGSMHQAGLAVQRNQGVVRLCTLRTTEPTLVTLYTSSVRYLLAVSIVKHNPT
jgi:hypothetical protein